MNMPKKIFTLTGVLKEKTFEILRLGLSASPEGNYRKKEAKMKKDHVFVISIVLVLLLRLRRKF
jgi:hypothetical protein